MKVLFSRKFVRNVRAINEYLRPKNPVAAEAVVLEIEKAIEHLAEWPHTGMSTVQKQTRRFVTSKYGYLIYYEVRDSRREILIKTVTHGRQHRPYQDA